MKDTSLEKTDESHNEDPLIKNEIETKSTSKKRIYDFLDKQSTGVLATIDPDGNPHATVIYFSVHPDGTLLFTTKARTKKTDNLKFSNKIMLVIYDALTQTTVQVTGKAENIDDKQLAQESFLNMIDTANSHSFSGTPPISQLYDGQYIAFQITPSQISMAVFMHPSRKGRDLFDNVVFFND